MLEDASARLIAATSRFMLGALLSVGIVAAANAQTVVMKLSTATLNDAQHEWMKRFAAKIATKSGGRIKAEVYPASQLGAIPRQIEGTQLGSIQLWVGPPEFLVGLDQRFEILSVPGLFQSDDQALKVLADAEFAKTFLALGANKGLIGASLFYTGPMTFVSRTPIRTLADIRGKKIRVLASPFQTEQVARLGGTGVPLSLGDVLPALQQGTLDGAMSAVPVFAALQYFDSAKYITETDHAQIFSTAWLSKRWFDGLPADLKTIVLETSKEVGQEVVPWSIEFLAQQRKVWVEKGGELIAISPAEKAELMQKMAPIGPEIVKQKPVLKPVWDALLAAVARNK